MDRVGEGVIVLHAHTPFAVSVFALMGTCVFE
jgi:hypothetical protein